jgi:hypothetical protein
MRTGSHDPVYPDLQLPIRRRANDDLLGGIPAIGNRLFYDHLALAVGAEDDGTIVLVNAGFRREREDIRAFAFISA